jgi:hypothetical protein
VVMEAGTHSPWISRLAQSMGHEVVVGNPSEIYGHRRSKRRNDTLDAEQLARMGRVDPALLSPIQHRGEQAQLDLAALQSRDILVKSRTKLINHVRGSVKAVGGRLPACSAEAFVTLVNRDVPESLHPLWGRCSARSLRSPMRFGPSTEPSSGGPRKPIRRPSASVRSRAGSAHLPLLCARARRSQALQESQGGRQLHRARAAPR